MMIHAYPEIYLSRAQSVLGDMFDYAINVCGFDGDDFAKLWMISEASERFEKGETSYISSRSGIEVAVDVISEATNRTPTLKLRESFQRSPEYWGGWAIAYYQWYSNRTYKEILSAVKFSAIVRMYYPLHEADITKFVDVMERVIREAYPDTNLKRIRALCGYSQSELARASGVSLRSIQMYEQRNKDINKASVGTVWKIARALGCSIEELLEK